MLLDFGIWIASYLSQKKINNLRKGGERDLDFRFKNINKSLIN